MKLIVLPGEGNCSVDAIPSESKLAEPKLNLMLTSGSSRDGGVDASIGLGERENGSVSVKVGVHLLSVSR